MLRASLSRTCGFATLDGRTVAYTRLRDRPERVAEIVRMLSVRPWTLISSWKLLRTTLARLWNCRRANPVHWYLVVASNLRIFSCAWAYKTDDPRTYLGGQDRLETPSIRSTRPTSPPKTGAPISTR